MHPSLLLKDSSVSAKASVSPEKEMAANSSALAWKSPMDRGAWWAAVQGITKSQT